MPRKLYDLAAAELRWCIGLLKLCDKVVLTDWCKQEIYCLSSGG